MGYFEDLPSSLLITIFSCLPVRDLFRARAVCRLWNTALASQELRCLWKPSHPDKCWVVMEVSLSSQEREVDNGSGEGEDEEEGEGEEQEVELRQWLEVWQPSTGARTRVPRGGLPPFHPPGAGLSFRFVASADGLICGTLPASTANTVCKSYHPPIPGYALAVGNPFTHTWRTLPPVQEPPFCPPCLLPCAFMWVDCNPSSSTMNASYKIALFTPNEPASPFQNSEGWILIYDSNEDRWERAPQFTRSSSGSLTTRTTPPCGVPLFFAPYPFEPYQQTAGTEQLDIGMYDLAARSWSAVAQAIFPMELDPEHWCYRAHRAFLYKGRCILVTLGMGSDFHTLLICTALELDLQCKAFKMLSKMPIKLIGNWHVYAELFDLEDLPFELVMEGAYVVVYARCDGVWPLVAFNMELFTWMRMQKYRPNPKYMYNRICTLSPSLKALP